MKNRISKTPKNLSSSIYFTSFELSGMHETCYGCMKEGTHLSLVKCKSVEFDVLKRHVVGDVCVNIEINLAIGSIRLHWHLKNDVWESAKHVPVLVNRTRPKSLSRTGKLVKKNKLIALSGPKTLTWTSVDTIQYKKFIDRENYLITIKRSRAMNPN